MGCFDVIVRKLESHDWQAASGLYAQLNSHRGGQLGDQAQFEAIIGHPGTSIFGAFQEGHLCAIATLHLLPNMSYAGRPYGLIENVVADAEMRKAGLGRAVMQTAIDAAREAGAYKVMLLTGRANDAMGFYEKLGFNSDEKAGMILRFP